MQLKSRIRALESKLGPSSSLMIFLSIDGELQSAHVEGVGPIGRDTSESNENFRQRVYAIEAAGGSLEGLTDVERGRAFQLGNQRHATSPSKTLTIGGDSHDAV